ncbi:unnamed protein product [Durusdinium trenchii]|uniref:Uncharacterized protein n=2 Tax=Durusdinium trenchii TaxID=1381693 RepID=A0ABP0KAB4_9DINO
MKKPSASSCGPIKKPSSSSSVMKGTKMKAMKVGSSLAVTGKAKAKAKAKARARAAKAEKDPRAEAIWMCQQLSDGKLNPESLHRGYVLLRNEAKKWVNSPKTQKLVNDLKQPADNWYHFMFAYVCGFMIDGVLQLNEVYKVLFSDEKDKRFFSCGVEHGHFIRDGANQFFEFLKAYQVSDFEAAIKGESSDMKLLEDLLVKFANLPQDTLAR